MSTTQPSGWEVTAVTDDDDAGLFTTTWSDGRQSQTTRSLEAALLLRQRARAVALRRFLKRK